MISFKENIEKFSAPETFYLHVRRHSINLHASFFSKFIVSLTIVNYNPSLTIVNDHPLITIVNIFINFFTKTIVSKTIVFLWVILKTIVFSENETFVNENDRKTKQFLKLLKSLFLFYHLLCLDFLFQLQPKDQNNIRQRVRNIGIFHIHYLNIDICHIHFLNFCKILNNLIFNQEKLKMCKFPLAGCLQKICNFFYRKTCAIRFLISKAFQKAKFYQKSGSGSKQRFSLLQAKPVIQAVCLRTQAVSIKARF